MPINAFVKSWCRVAAVLLLVSLLLAPISPAVYALDIPELLAPAESPPTTVDNYPPLGVPEFQWSPVAGALTYRFQISPDVGFATTPINITTANTRYTPTSVTPLPDGDWYWRVRVETPAAGEYSALRKFTKQWASAGNKPTLTDPAPGAVFDLNLQPSFSWQPIAGAASYCLQIATSDVGFSSACTASGTQVVAQSTVATTIQPLAKLANGSYFWRVVPVDPGGHNGTVSEVRSFTAGYDGIPLLLEPQNDALPTFTPTFRWTAVQGAQYYTLQYSTFQTFDQGLTSVDTRNTTYTPATPLPNDVNYWWRVRVRSGASVGDWSEVRHFMKQWYLQPQLLTPVNNYQYVKDPFFSWTPVPGASHYKIEINNAISFPPVQNVTGWTDETATPFYAVPDQIVGIIWCWSCAPTWYWRVTPVDAAGNLGLPSATSSFNYNPGALAPQLIHPLYYYSPSDYLAVHEDRTVSLPVFTWHRTLSYTLGNSGFEVPAYRLQVDDDPLFLSPNWTVNTENLSAAPTASNPFTPTVDGVYYWRVRPLTTLGGALTNQWSQAWKTKINTTQGLAPTSSLILLRPTDGSESVETFPLLEWWPLQGVDSYEVQVSADSTFGTVDLSATVPYPAYMPPTRLHYGTYYWQVRGLSGGNPVGAWSAPWRFQIAAQSRWRSSRPVSTSPTGSALLAQDPAGDMTDANYDLTTLYEVQSPSHWLFGFNVAAPSVDVTYGLYLDLDHLVDSGATTDARGYAITTPAAHLPEYAIYFLRPAGSFTSDDVAIYHWTGSEWAPPQLLSAVGGFLSAEGSYVEVALPNTAIGMDQTTGSAAVTLFSALSAGGHAQDTVPSDPAVAYSTPDAGPATTELTRLTGVSEHLNLARPPSNLGGDPSTFASIPPFRYQFPVDTSWYGYQFRAATDQNFTSVMWTYTIFARSSGATPLVPPAHTYNDNGKNFAGDNSYYWQVRTVYSATASQPTILGAWSQASRFERQGQVPSSLTTTVTFATPTFNWAMVEGARNYEIQVDNDSNFGSPEVSATTQRESYTPTGTLADGTYYWRVRVRQYGGSTSSTADVIGDWIPAQQLVLSLPQPTGLSAPAQVVGPAPTLCWDPLLASSGGDPVLAAYKYRVQVSKDAAFSAIFDTVDTEQTCWTPTKGYDDGTYYWHVAMIDGNTTPRVGSYSPYAQFAKQYPIPQLVGPLGGTSAQTPTFAWTRVDGAAKYRVEISVSPTFSTLYEPAVTTDNTQYTPTKKYAVNTTYYWRVAVVDRDGKIGPFTGSTVLVSQFSFDYHVMLPLVLR